MLEKLNNGVSDSIDWQVTTCFYTAVHIMNAHLAKIEDLHYKTHDEVDRALNPFSLHKSKLDKEHYLAYEKLRNLSRRSRYLCHDDPNLRGNNSQGFTTDERHLAKAIKNLDILLTFCSVIHEVKFPRVKITCSKFSASDHFNFITNPFNRPIEKS